MAAHRAGSPRRLIYGAPTLNWILLADYLILGLLALAHSFWTDRDPEARRPILVLLLGTIAGIVPFVVFAVFYPSLFRDERYLAWGVVPMALIPLSFAIRHRPVPPLRRHGHRPEIARLRRPDGRRHGHLRPRRRGRQRAPLVVLRPSPSPRPRRSPSSSASPSSSSSTRSGAGRRVSWTAFSSATGPTSSSAILDMSRSVVSQLERDKIRELMTERTAELLRLSSLDLLLPRPADGAFADPRAEGALRPPDGEPPAAAPRGETVADPARRVSTRRSLDDASRPRSLEAETRRGVRVSRARRDAWEAPRAFSPSGRSGPRRSCRARTSIT